VCVGWCVGVGGWVLNYKIANGNGNGSELGHLACIQGAAKNKTKKKPGLERRDLIKPGAYPPTLTAFCVDFLLLFWVWVFLGKGSPQFFRVLSLSGGSAPTYHAQARFFLGARPPFMHLD
jgi:hypothetical protein